MDQERAVNKVLRDLKASGLINPLYSGEVKSFLDQLWVAGWEAKQHDTKNAEEKEVFQYDKKGNLITSYPSVTKAAKALKCTREGMYRAIKKGTPTRKGYIWSYKKRT